MCLCPWVFIFEEMFSCEGEGWTDGDGVSADVSATADIECRRLRLKVEDSVEGLGETAGEASRLDPAGVSWLANSYS